MASSEPPRSRSGFKARNNDAAANIANMPLVTAFFDEPIEPTLVPARSSHPSFFAGEQAKQLNVMNLEVTYNQPRYVPQYFLLDHGLLQEIYHSTQALLSSIHHASTHRRSPNAIKSALRSTQWFLTSIYGASSSPADELSPQVRGRGLKDASSLFLHSCENLIYDFLSNIETGKIYKSSDIQELQLGLRERLECLVLSLSHGQRSGTSIDDSFQATQRSFQNTSAVAQGILRYLSQHHDINVSDQTPTQSLALLERPLVICEASKNASWIPIPHEFCESKLMLHSLLQILFRNRPWHTKVDQEEYVLEIEDSSTIAGAENWHDVVVPGGRLYMTMVVRRAGGEASDTCCPGCRATNIERIARGKRIKCLNCTLVSSAVNNYQITELADDVSANASPALQLSDTVPETEFSRIVYADQTIVPRASPAKDTLPEQSAKGSILDTLRQMIDKGGQEVMERISGNTYYGYNSSGAGMYSYGNYGGGYQQPAKSGKWSPTNYYW
ncbi:hypothetical protein BDV95DRAFT_622344 [Massariosphaeria phaeospora]|uniref:Ubiquitin-like domain-containing protein n=1 Tax=Massariosphaeria phaeospora TaxID=100035 RepID=A0A7C8M3G3_9PLEO|nr:hypothetical protein BDV95DRAFT_622344 [Massariosphaeria phaeospora]